MQTPDLSAAAPPEMRELSASRQTWYTGRHGDRIYWVYTPASYQAGTAVPVIMVLHGCAQPFFSHPWAIAYDTHMNQLAEAHQFLVVYPHEFAPPDVNPMSCWNFFLPDNQQRGEGEPASLAGIVQDMLSNTAQWTIDPQRIYVGGEITEVWDLIGPVVREGLGEDNVVCQAGEPEILTVGLGEYPRLRGAAALISTPAFAAAVVS